MCGRYGRRADKQRIAEWMQAHNTSVFDETYLAPSYNVAPTDSQPIVRLDRDGQRELTAMCWGLVPYCVLGEGFKDWLLHNQCEVRNRHYEPNISRGDEAPALPGSCGMVL
jgi:putative SOS response-associated peptidase YedK